MPTSDPLKPNGAASNSTPLQPPAAIRIFLDQTREAFKATLKQLAEHGVPIRSFTELHGHAVDVEAELPITQQLIIQAYRHAVLVSTVEALFKQTAPATSPASDGESAHPGRDEGQE